MQADPARRPRPRGRRDPCHPDQRSTCCDDGRGRRRRVRRRAPSGPYGPSSRAAGSRVDGRGRRGDLAGPGRGPLARSAPRTLYHAIPSRCSATTSGSCRSACSRWATTSAAPTASSAAAPPGAVAQFQREVGLVPDGACGPQTMAALRRLGRKVIGGRPTPAARDRARSAQSGPALVGKRIVIDPGHGGGDPGVRGPRRAAALDRGRHRLRPRRPAGGPAGRRRHAGPPDPRTGCRASR